MQILITGGPGFIGSRLTSSLKNQGYANVSTPPQSEMDISNRSMVAETVLAIRPDWIFHLAADTSKGEEASPRMKEVNVDGTRNLLLAASECKVKAFVAVGSFAEYGDAPVPFREDGPAFPTSPYGLSKSKATQLVIEYGKSGLPATVLRFSNVYGPGMSEKPFIGKVLSAVFGGPKVPTSPSSKRDFLHVDDAVRALIIAAEKIDNCRGEVINVCSGGEASMAEVIRIAERISSTSKISFADDSATGTMVISNRGCNEKVKELLGWTPEIGLEDGLRDLLAWRSNIQPL